MRTFLNLLSYKSDRFLAAALRELRVIFLPSVALSVELRDHAEGIHDVFYICLETEVGILEESIGAHDSLHVESAVYDESLASRLMTA